MRMTVSIAAKLSYPRNPEGVSPQQVVEIVHCGVDEVRLRRKDVRDDQLHPITDSDAVRTPYIILGEQAYVVRVGLGLLDDLLCGGDGRFANSIDNFLVAPLAIGKRVCPKAHGSKFAPILR